MFTINTIFSAMQHFIVSQQETNYICTFIVITVATFLVLCMCEHVIYIKKNSCKEITGKQKTAEKHLTVFRSIKVGR